MPSDRIEIRDLEVSCIIGIQPKERVAKQTISLNLVLECDLSRACASDDIHDTVDYKVLKDRILDEIGASEHFLIERLADHVIGLCMSDGRVERVTVCVDKPGALTGARSVAVQITRDRRA